MKSFATLSLAALAGLVAAVPVEDSCNVIADNDPTTNPADVQPIVVALLAINGSTTALSQEITEFDGSQASVDELLAASQALLAQITTSTDDVAAIDPVPADNEFDVLNLTPYVAQLACNANFTVQQLKAIKQELVDACQGPTTLEQIQGQLQGSGLLINTTITKIPETDNNLPGLARELSQPILDALQDGVDSFADQTALPASCAGSSTSSASSSSTSSASSVSSTSSGSVTVTSSTYGAKPTDDEDCDESSSYYASPSKPASYPAVTSYPAKPTSSSKYIGSSSSSCTEESSSSYYKASTSSAKPSTSKYVGSSSSSCTESSFTSSYYKPSSSSYGGSKPSSSVSYSYPVGSYSSSSYAPKSTGGYHAGSSSGYAKPSGSKNSGYGASKSTGGYYPSTSAGGHATYPAGGAKPTTAPTPKYPAYTGAGVANVANVFGLLVAAIGAVALL